MLNLRTLLLIVLTSQQVYSQVHTISGYVEDVNTGERIIGAYIIDSKTQNVAQTNNYGFYNFKTIEKYVELHATYVGLKSTSIYVSLKHDTIINIEMQPVRELNEVSVTSFYYKHNVNSDLGLSMLNIKQLISMPSLGESDLVKSIQNQPGIQGGIEGSTGVFVRGGGAGENLFMLDEIPMYNISHLYGFFSIFNSSAIKDIKLYKGCFPARYGGRASSVIDVRSLDGNNKYVRGELSIGFISSKFTLEGPLFSHKTTFFITGRRSYLDLYSGTLKSLNLMNLNFPGYYFYDINTRLTKVFSPSDRLFLGLYIGKDKIHFKDEPFVTKINSETITDFNNETSGWGNVIGSMRWNHTFGANLFVNTTIAYSQYNYFILSHYYSLLSDSILDGRLIADYTASYKSKISDLIIKSDVDLTLSNKHKLTMGLGITTHCFNPGSNAFKMFNIDSDEKMDTSYVNKYLSEGEIFLYLEDEMKLSHSLSVSSGLRISGLISKNEVNINPEPRFSANYNLSPKLVIKTGYSRMVQYLHLLSTSDFNMTTDIWIPALKGLKPLKSDQINFGIAYDWTSIALISAEIYRKWLYNTTDLLNGASFFTDLTPWFEKATQGHGNAKGIELSIEKQEARFTWSINYTYSKADRKYQSLNNGNIFPFKYDRRHDLNLSLNYQISKKWDISVLWLFGTGYPVTVPIEKYFPALNTVSSLQHNLLYYYPSLNNYRLPAYHRLDIGFHYIKETKHCEHKISLDVFNAYNNNNPVNMYYKLNYSFRYVYLFPIIPSVTYTVKFK